MAQHRKAWIAMVLILLLFAFVAAGALIINLLTADENKEMLAGRFQALDAEIMLQSLLRYEHNGNEMRTWIIESADKLQKAYGFNWNDLDARNNKEFQEFSKGFNEYFKDSYQYAAVRIYVNGWEHASVGPTMEIYDNKIALLPDKERKEFRDKVDNVFTPVDVYIGKEGTARQAIPYFIEGFDGNRMNLVEVELVQVEIPRGAQ